MATEWQPVTIDDLKADSQSAIAMGPFGSDITTDNFVDFGVPVIRGVNLAGDRFVDDGFVFLTEEKADELRAANVFPGDLVFTHRGTLGQVGIIPRHARFPRYVVSQSQMKLTCDTRKAVPEYLYYFFKSPVGQHALLANTSTTGVPAIARPVTSLKAIRVALPELDEQRAIARVLGTLDDQIELNRIMNKTLEAMLRTLFRAWFVNFDFIRDNSANRLREFAGLPASSFYESELGEIPVDWRPGTLGEVTCNRREGVRPSEIAPQTPYIGLEHMPRKSIALTEWGDASALESNKFKFRRGEILFGKLRPYFHKVGVAPVDGVCSTDILVLYAKEADWFGFVLGHAASAEFVEHTNAGSTGTKMPRTSWPEMAQYKLVIPPKPVAARFTELIGPIIERILSNIHLSRSCARVRDTLLPKLLSGDRRIKHVDRIIGDIR